MDHSISISKLHGPAGAEKRNYTVGPSGYIATLMRIPEMYTDTSDNKKLIIGIKIGICKGIPNTHRDDSRMKISKLNRLNRFMTDVRK